MTRREANAEASRRYIEAAAAFQAGMISREELNRALAAYEAARSALRARRVVH